MVTGALGAIVSLVATCVLDAVLCESPGDCMMLWVPYCVNLMVTA